MSVCPLCNGLRAIKITCDHCGNEMYDRGKIMDYYDDYSPYMEIDLLKMEDGYPDTYSQHQCPHLYSCLNCAKDKIIFIKE
jgi:hypothetical protein